MFSEEFIKPTLSTMFEETLQILDLESPTNIELYKYYMRCEEHLNFLVSNEVSIDKNLIADHISLVPHLIRSKGNDSVRKEILNMYGLVQDNLKMAAIFAAQKGRYWGRNKKGIMGKRIVVFINGHNQVGKDTFIDLLKHYSTDTVHNISTVDKVKEAALILGWHGEKDENAREALHKIKMLANKHFDHSKKYLHEFITKHSNCITFIHCREPKELEFYTVNLPEMFDDLICKTLLIKNLRVEPANNDADKNVEEFVYSDTVWNNGTIEEFKEKAKIYLDKLIEEVHDGINS